MASQARIINVTDIPSASPDRAGTIDKFVIWEDPTGRRHTLIIPDADYTLQAAEEAIRKAWQSAQQSAGHAFDV